MRNFTLVVVVCILLGAASARAVRQAEAGPDFGPWSAAVNIEDALPGADASLNLEIVQDGCPAVSRDGLSLYLASNRLPSRKLDVWVSRRDSVNDPWGAPVNLGAPVNTQYDEFCPTPLRDGHGLLFVSRKPGGCDTTNSTTTGDIYITRQRVDGTWDEPQNLGCVINSAGEEASPFFVEYDDGTGEFFFSSNRAGGPTVEPAGVLLGDSDIYVSQVSADGVLGTPVPVPGLNTGAQDWRPSVRRDGLEIFFDSNRPDAFAQGGQDVYSATRTSRSQPWSTPENLVTVNSPDQDTRAFISWDMQTLYVGRTPVGTSWTDIFQATRDRIRGPRD